MNNKIYTFHAEIEAVPDKGGAYIRFPYDVREEFGKGRVKAEKTFDGELKSECWQRSIRFGLRCRKEPDMQKILIVEDDEQNNQMLKEYLEDHGYVCTQAYSGSEAKLRFSMGEYDLVLLDLMLPGISGEELVSAFSEKAPVIVMSAKSGLDSKVEVLSAGAEDYICKPFDLPELLVRQKNSCLIFENPVSETSRPDTEQIFERFYKADSARRKGSSGLGLFIVKELAEQ